MVNNFDACKKYHTPTSHETARKCLTNHNPKLHIRIQLSNVYAVLNNNNNPFLQKNVYKYVSGVETRRASTILR